MRSLNDCPADLSPQLERSRELVKHVRRLEREDCAAFLRAQAKEWPHGVALALRMIADRMTGA